MASDFELMPSRYEDYNKVLLTYTEDAILRYRITDINELLNNTKILLAMIKHHYRNQVPRLETLENYYIGNNESILKGQRRRDKDKADNRIRHSFANTISNFLNSYVIGNPVKIASNDEKFTELLDEFNFKNDIDAHNLEIGKDQNNLGRAYELLQRTEEDQDKVYRLEPKEVFMIYDTTVRSRVIGACRYIPINTYELDSSKIKYLVELYTFDHIYRFEPIDINNAEHLVLPEDGIEEHYFNGVPIVEYRSDRFRMGVYEQQLSLIDAYDSAESDTANYMTDTNDALLVIEGRLQNAKDKKYVEGLKDANILILEPAEDSITGATGTVKAQYLTKSYDVQGVEAYKTRLRDDIFNLSSTPDLSDQAFSGNQSGEALKYKMYGLQQKRNDKERFLSKGFRVRYKLLENIKRATNEYTGEPVELTFTYTPNLPKAYLEELQAFRNSGGQLSQETMLSLLSFIDSVEDEKERIENEKEVSDIYSDIFD